MAANYSIIEIDYNSSSDESDTNDKQAHTPEIESDTDEYTFDVDSFDVDSSDVDSIPEEVITVESLRCTVCENKDNPVDRITSRFMVCRSCDRNENQIIKSQKYFKYTCVMCKDIGNATLINGSFFCHFCLARFARYQKAKLYQSCCIENLGFCQNKLCNHCFAEKLKDVSGRIYLNSRMIPEIDFENKWENSYSYFIEQNLSEFKANHDGITRVNFDKYERSWQLIHKLPFIMSNINEDLKSSNKTKVKHALMIYI